ncbi:MAG TPA: type II secretion system F family protein [Tahibacter sp.]|nr:type II secretion system F family protein [Tahibacter sp.]
MSSLATLLPTLVISAIVALAVAALFISLGNIKSEIRDDDRTYMDPLPGPLRKIWPLVNLLVQHFGDFLPVEQVESVRLQMRKAGVEYLMTPVQFIATRFVAAALFGLVGLLVMLVMEKGTILIPIGAALLGSVFPLMKLNDLRRTREKQIVRLLPTYLDFITMAVEAGMNLSGAIAQGVEKGPEGPLRMELQRVMRDIKAGMGRMDAIRAMSERLNVREITALTSALAQAEKTGARLGPTLKIQADQRRSERFQRAEKLALEAPVKLIFPLVAFIFPTTFLVLGFPILMKFLHEV